MPNVPAHPIDAVDTDGNASLDAPVFTAKTIRQASSVFLGGASSARPLGSRTGVRHGTPTNTVTATATTWTVKPHAGVIDLESSAVAGPYSYVVAADLTGPVTPASGSGSRVDIIYAQINDPGELDGTPATTAGHVKIDYAAGTGGSSTPAVTPARAFVLAYIDVPVSGGGSPTVRWVAPYTMTAGGITPVRTEVELVALGAYGSAEGPVYANRLDNGVIYRLTGGTPQPIAGVGPWNNVSSFPVNFTADPVVTPRWRYNGPYIECDGIVRKVGAITSAPQTVCTLTGAPNALQAEYTNTAFFASGSGVPGAGMVIASGNAVQAAESTGTCDRVSLAGVRYRWA